MSKDKSSSENSPGAENSPGEKSGTGAKKRPDEKKGASTKDTKKPGNAATSNKKLPNKDISSHNKVIKENTITDKNNANKNSVKSSGNNKFSFIVSSVLLLIIAITISGLYLLWQQQKQDQKTQSRLIAALKSDIEQYSHNQNRLQSELDNKISNELGGIRHTVDALQELAGKNHRDWVLSETVYLLQIANHRLQLEGDIKTTIKALMIADSKLKNLADPSLLPVRKHLADETSALQSTSQPDIYGMVLALDSLQAKSVQMKLKIAIPSATIADAKTMADTSAKSNKEKMSIKDWQRALNQVWKELKTLVVINKHDQRLAPILTTEQQQTIKHILQLKIQGIRTALLSKQPEIFLLSIKDTLQWLQKHFSHDDPNVSLLKSRLQEFEAIRLKVDIPDISGSLQALQSLQKSKKELPAPAIQMEKL